MESLFIDLIRVSVGSASCLSSTPSDSEWEALYDLSKKQSLVGVCFAGVRALQKQHQGPPELLYLKWMGMAAKVQQRNDLMNQRCVEVQQRLNDDGFKSVILKGQGVALYYPDNLRPLRQSGDIDVWMEGGRKKVIDYVQKISPTKEIREIHAHLDLYADTDVEAHFSPGYIRNFKLNKNLQKFFSEMSGICFSNKVRFVEGMSLVVPTTGFNVIHQLAHLHVHLMGGGVGLRQLMDFYYVLKAYVLSHDVPREKIQIAISDIGMDKFCGAVMWLLAYVFDGANVSTANWRDVCPWMITCPRIDDGMFLLNEILIFGNFGKYDKRFKTSMDDNLIKRFVYPMVRNIKLQRFAPLDWLMSPIWRLYYYSWRKVNGYE